MSRCSVLAISLVLLPSCSERIIVGWDEGAAPAPDASVDDSFTGDTESGPEAETGGLSACDEAAGICVADPSECDGGSLADAGSYGCSVPGMRCCLPVSDAGGDSGVPSCESEGGTCLSVGPTSCSDGHWTGPAQNSCNGVVGVLCCLPGATPLPEGGTYNPCEAIGGQCILLGPNLCDHALWDAPIPFLCGAALDQGCCFPL